MLVVLLIHAAATWALVGLIWIVQLVHYPLFKSVGSEQFKEYHARHTQTITWIVAPLMFVELGTAIALVVGKLLNPSLLMSFVLLAWKCIGQEEAVAGYKALGNVERAFRSLKTTQLEIRPVYHKLDDRIKAHAFLCVLAYYVQWHLVERVRPIFEADGTGEDRRWTVQNIIERLAAIRSNRVEVGGVKFDQISEFDSEQKQIINLLQIAM